jgi:hypothetical protein
MPRDQISPRRPLLAGVHEPTRRIVDLGEESGPDTGRASYLDHLLIVYEVLHIVQAEIGPAPYGLGSWTRL